MKEKLLPLSWVEIDAGALKHNFSQIQRLAAANTFELGEGSFVKKTKNILAVVKADAYGHGMANAARTLDPLGVSFFGVANALEGVALRKLGTKKPILIFENSLEEFADVICNYNLTPTVCTFELAKVLNERAKRTAKKIDVHIKVDTGMGRMGVWHANAYDFIQKVYRLPYLKIQGIYTHFPSADSDKKFTQGQIRLFHELLIKLHNNGIDIPFVHAANSMGLAGYKTRIFNLFRPGLMLYGEYPHDRLKKKIRLKPVMSVYSRVIFIKEIEKGRGVSYGRTFIAKKKMTVATIPIGYKDGFLRSLSNKADVLINGQRCRVLGRVTMDQIIVDVTDVKGVRLGAFVTIIGRQGAESIGTHELAANAGTISYEICCSLGNSLPRYYK